jgi:hypothetical protein
MGWATLFPSTILFLKFACQYFLHPGLFIIELPQTMNFKIRIIQESQKHISKINFNKTNFFIEYLDHNLFEFVNIE